MKEKSKTICNYVFFTLHLLESKATITNTTCLCWPKARISDVVKSSSCLNVKNVLRSFTYKVCLYTHITKKKSTESKVRSIALGYVFLAFSSFSKLRLFLPADWMVNESSSYIKRRKNTHKHTDTSRKSGLTKTRLDL